jgi:hypothetical protein
LEVTLSEPTRPHDYTLRIEAVRTAADQARNMRERPCGGEFEEVASCTLRGHFISQQLSRFANQNLIPLKITRVPLDVAIYKELNPKRTT